MKAHNTVKAFSIAFIFCTTMAVIGSAQLTTLHTFTGSDGANPVLGLILASDGNYYGTTYNAGSNSGINAGTVFKITPSGTLTTLYTFCHQPPYCSDGLHPFKILQGRDGNFYGVTVNGGTENYPDSGFIFKLTASGHESVLAQFCSLINGCGFGPLVGSNPGSVMQASDGNFYGVTFNGGDGAGGALWQLVANSWTLNLLFSFDTQDTGIYPTVTLVQGRDGQLYGMTPHGGTGLPNCASYCGTLFKITLSGHETVLYNFCSQSNCTDGTTPDARLTQGSDGNFYGSTFAGGADGAGVIFKFTPGGTYTVLHTFTGSDGSGVLAPLLQGSDGNFYGTASRGGAHGYGVIFQITPSGAYTVLHSFNNADGANPQGEIVEDSHGNFYGTTLNGGASGDGTVFKFQVTYDTLTVTTSGDGVVTSTDGIINCPGTCSHPYPNGTQVTLNATPASGWAFTGWGGACSGTGSCQVTMTQTTNVSAGFTQLPVTLTVSTAGSGSITSTDGFINCPGTCTHVYQPNTPVTLNATPATNWAFSGWTGACSGVGTCSIVMTANLAVTAVFVEPGHGIQFTSVTPCRLVDTRNANGTFGGPAIQGGTSRSFPMPQNQSCNIPAAAAAYSLNVTVVPHKPLNYLTIWPTGEAQPYVSTMNSPDARVKANAAIVPAGTSGAVSVFVTDTSDVILDIDGYFQASGAYEFYPLTPCRVVDTRSTSTLTGGLGPPSFGTNEARPLPILSSTCFQHLPNQPLAYSFNVTVAPYPPGQSLNYLTIWPTGEQQPYVSTLNNGTAGIVANAAIVPAAANGDVSVYTYNSTDVIIDTNGYFAAPGTGYSFYPTAPCRAYDSRNNGGQSFTGTRTVNIVGSPCAPPSNAKAYVFNATVVPSPTLPYLTLWAHGQTMPVVSTLNAYDGFITSNMAIVPNTDGSTDALAAQGYTQLILDISGYFAP